MKDLGSGIPNPTFSLLNKSFCELREKELIILEKSNSNNLIRTRCPECSNYLMATMKANGGVSGNCPICKSTFYSKQHSVNERLIRIIKHSA